MSRYALPVGDDMEHDFPVARVDASRWSAPHWSDARRVVVGWPWGAILPATLVGLVALALRVALILRYPLLYDIDAYGRWSSRNQPFNTPWVPLFQVALYLLTRVADSILAARLLSAFFGATAALAFWLLLRRAFGASVAYLGALLLALNPLFVTFSIVPYQEGLFLTLAFLALWLALAPDKIPWFWLTLTLALAGLTRYEGWLLSLFIWLLFLWQRRGTLTWRFAAGSALALAWAPLLWIVINQNVSPTGIQTLSPTADPASLLATLGTEWPAWQVGLSLVGGALALGGLLWLGWQAWHERASDQRERDWPNPERPSARPRRGGRALAWLLLAFLLGDVLVLAFLRPFSPGNLRLPILALPVVIAGMAGLLVDGARLAWRVVSARRPAWMVWQRALMVGLFGLATVALLVGYLPLDTQEVAGYNTVVRPSYQSAGDVGTLGRDATIVVVGNNTAYYAFLFYAQQDGWRGQALQLATLPATPGSLADALRVAQARALVNYTPASASASIEALAQQGALVPDAQGAGYAIWRVQPAPASGP